MTCRLTLLLLIGVAAAGCAADPGASASETAPAAAPVEAVEAVEAVVGASAPISACALLTSAEVTSIIGQPVLEPQPNGFECAFRREGERGLLVRAVRVRLEQGAVPAYELYDRYTAAIRTALNGEYEPQPVAGIGSVAGWDGDALLAADRTASGQTFMLVVQLDGVDAGQQQAYAEAIARAALTRLRILAAS